MRYPGFIGGSATSRSQLANNERTVNWYPENAGDRLVLYPTPGFSRVYDSTGGVGCRAMFAENNLVFIVMGNTFYQVVGTVAVARGAVTADAGLAQIVSNGVTGGQLLVSSGGDAFCYTIATQAFAQVVTGEAHMIGTLDGYFLAFNKNNGKVRFSGINNGTSWNALDFFLRGIAPDQWRAMTVNQGRIWLIGEHTGEVWWDQGGASIPFAPIPSSVFSFGIAAPASLVCVGDTVRWLSQSVDGDGIFVSARGYRPERISDHATEYAIKQLKTTGRIDDCETLTYQEVGHTYTVLRFPTAGMTRVYDDATQLWHERGYWNWQQQRYTVWTPRTHMVVGGQHLIGMVDSPSVFAMDQRYQVEHDTAPIRRLRAAPVLAGEGGRVYCDRIELLLEPGLAGQPLGIADDPRVSLSMSYDNGKTWGNERFVGAGRVGQYRRRLIWARNGSGSSVQARIVCSDPVPWNVIDCFIEASGLSQLRAGGAAAA